MTIPAEGRMLDFFDSMDTSDKLINRFFIPAIDSRIAKGNSRDDADASLSTMFINYAKKVYGKSDLIREQQVNREFLNDLSEIKSECIENADINNRYITSQAEGFAFRSSLVIEKNSSVKVFDDDNPKKMIRFDMSKDEESLDIQAENAIKIEINKGVDEISQIMSKPDVKYSELSKKANAYVGSDRLLHLYVGMGRGQKREFRR